MKVLILIATLLLSVAIELARRRNNSIRPQGPTPRQTHTYLQRFRETKIYRGLIRLFQLALVLSAVGQAIVAFWGPFRPTKPRIEFHDTIDSSSFVLPFKITNESILFPQNNIPVSCGIDLVYFVDTGGKPGIVKNVMFEPPPISIGRASVNNYPCTASQYLRVTDNGFLEIGFERNTRTEDRSVVFHRPLTILKMCVWISGFYNVLGWKRPFGSKIFQWPAQPGQRQWIEGPITPDLPNEAWLPPGTSPPIYYSPNVLQCTRL